MGNWKSKRTAALLLRDLWRLTRRAMEFPNGDLTVGNTLAAATQTATELADDCGGTAVIGRVGAGFNLNGQLLPTASLHFRDLHHQWAERHIESITFWSPVASVDLADLVRVCAGSEPNGPTIGTIRLNETVAPAAHPEGLSIEEIRRYVTSVDEQRESEDADSHRMTGTMVPDEEAIHYLEWVSRIRQRDDVDTSALLGELPERLR